MRDQVEVFLRRLVDICITVIMDTYDEILRRGKLDEKHGMEVHSIRGVI